MIVFTYLLSKVIDQNHVPNINGGALHYTVLYSLYHCLLSPPHTLSVQR